MTGGESATGRAGQPNPSSDTRTDGRCVADALLTDHVSVRITSETDARLDALVAADSPFQNRGDAARAAFSAGFDALEAKYLEGEQR